MFVPESTASLGGESLSKISPSGLTRNDSMWPSKVVVS
jgi:hypothetical protein